MSREELIETLNETKKLEEKLRESEAKLKEANQIMAAMLEHTHMMAALLDHKFNFILVNRAYAETCHYEPSFFPGKNHFDLYPHKENQEIFQRVVDTGEPFFVDEKPFFFPDQPERGITYWDWSLIPVKDDSSKVILLVFTLSEVTGKVKAEEALREAYRLNEQIIFSAKEGIIVYDHNLKYKLWNPFMEELTGYEASDVIGKDPMELFPFLKETGVMERLEMALAGKLPEPVDLPYFVSKTGKSGWTLNKSSPLRNFAGEITGVIGIVHDITERKKIEHELRENEKKLRAIADYTCDLEHWFGNDGKLIWVNPAVLQFTGYSVDECFAMKDYPFPIIYEYDRDLIAGAFSSACQGCSASNLECRIICKDGSLKWAGISYQAIYDLHGNNIGHRSSVRDITSRKKAEEEKEKLQLQLFQSQRTESLGRMVGGVAHNFNNILGVIQGVTELAMMDIDPDNPLYCELNQILESTHTASNLVKQLLAYVCRQMVRPEIIDINETIAGMIKMLRTIISENIELIWKPGNEIWKVRVDPNQLNQILTNLTVNARDAISGNGSIIIETSNVCFDSLYFIKNEEILPGDYILLSVSDTGTGMSKEVMEKIFEPFFTTKEVGSGTGLGLSTVYGIVHQNNGFVNVYSKEGKGATFKIYLPRFYTESNSVSAEKKVVTVTKGGTEVILIAEDEEAYLIASKRMLEKQGYTVLAAKTPGEAIHIAENYPGDIQLLITDVIMPEMNGRKLLKKIDKIRPGIKCIYISGYPASVITPHCVRDKGVTFLEKPFSTKAIADKVRNLLDSQ